MTPLVKSPVRLSSFFGFYRYAAFNGPVLRGQDYFVISLFQGNHSHSVVVCFLLLNQLSLLKDTDCRFRNGMAFLPRGDFDCSHDRINGWA